MCLLYRTQNQLHEWASEGSVGFHLDVGAWKGDETLKRLFLCVISQGLPLTPTYGLLQVNMP